LLSPDNRNTEHDRTLFDLSHDVKAPNSATLNWTGDIQREHDFEQVDYTRE